MFAPNKSSRELMEKVLGIGGVFFRAQDPKALADWYSTHLGINKVPDNYKHLETADKLAQPSSPRSPKPQNIRVT